MRLSHRRAEHRAPHRRRIVATALATLALPAVAAPAVNLAELLARVAASARFDPAVRADVRIACDIPCHPAQATLVGRGDALYVQAGEVRALVKPDGVRVAKGGKGIPAAIGAPLGDTGVLLEDLVVFAADSLKVPQISDEGPTGVVIMGAPTRPSAYALLVHTIDPDRGTIEKTQYYQGSINNLAKIRRDRSFVRVGGGWRPGEVEMTRIGEDKSARLTLAWREMPEVPPALFEPAGLEGPPPALP
jgi:hypothetical protein